MYGGAVADIKQHRQKYLLTSSAALYIAAFNLYYIIFSWVEDNLYININIHNLN